MTKVTLSNLLRSVFLMVIFLSCDLLSSQQFLHTDGKAIVNEDGDEVLLRGMGLGGWMLQEGYMLQTAGFASAQYQIREKIEELIGEEQTDEFYDAWLANHVREPDIAAMKSWGFNSVRVPMHFNLFTLPIEDEPVAGENTWLEKGFELLDDLLLWCEIHDMYVILDLHAAPGGQGYDQGISDYNPDLPSLWESPENKSKTVALWRELAERYADESIIAGYDLLNETNWDLPGGQALRDLYIDITNAIREVDQTHIIFIEGNWFANDFTGLTPPWDDNLVYSPHKYWSFNDQASIQWVLDLREAQNVPLYFGESGENSNLWFKEAIELFESNNIGWAWWPLKKIESIAGPLSIEKTPGYTSLLDYWNGSGAAPSAADAYDILMDLTEKLQFENCKLQADVIDAMFRQQSSDETISYASNSVPGVVYATDFDLGTVGQAYSDIDDANYHVSTGNYTAWNNGWIYRNDGVDIEICEDGTNSNGHNIAWTESGEWMKYTLDVTSAGIYDVHLRISAPSAGSSISFEVDEAKASDDFPVPNTGGYQEWQTLVVPGLVFKEGNEELICNVEAGGFNLSSYDFIYKGASTDLAFEISKAKTVDQQQIELQFNKSVDSNSELSLEDFSLELNGQESSISSLSYSQSSARKVLLSTDQVLHGDHQIRVSYQGDNILAQDGTALFPFEKFFVENDLPPLLGIPGIIQAESFTVADGVEIEECIDVGQGFNIAYLDPGDYLEYQVEVLQSAEYLVRYRAASQSVSGAIRLSLIDADGNSTIIDEPSFPVTGGWQTWQTVENEIDLEAGQYVMRIEILNAPFNLNWLEFESLFVEEEPDFELRIAPNIVTDFVRVQTHFASPHRLSYYLFDTSGRKVGGSSFEYASDLDEEISLRHLSSGMYFLHVILENDQTYLYKLYKD